MTPPETSTTPPGSTSHPSELSSSRASDATSPASTHGPSFVGGTVGGRTPAPSARPMRLGIVTAVVLLLGGIGWGVFTQISGAVIAMGRVDIRSDTYVIQHPDGGIVAELAVRDGAAVAPGDLLLRLDGTLLEAELTAVETQIHEMRVAIARLEAERDGREEVQMPARSDLSSLDPDQAWEIETGQADLFTARQNGFTQTTARLRAQQDQLGHQVTGLETQRTALETRRSLLDEDLAAQETLAERGVATAVRAREIQREMAEVDGEIGRITAAIAEARARQAEIDLDLLERTEARQSEILSELRQLGLDIASRLAQRAQILDQLARLELRAPAAGTVFATQVPAPGAVVRPADPIMTVVPGDEPLEVTLQVDPIHVDEIASGQPVTLRFTSFNTRTTPEIPATVARIAPDALQDPQTGMSWFEVVVDPDSNILADTGLELRPGLPVEAFIEAEARSPLSWLIRPFTDQLNRAMREE